MAFAIAATALCVFSCISLVIAEHRLAMPGLRERFAGLYREFMQVRVLAKCLASACFLVVGAAALDKGDPFSQWMFIGLVFGALGDVLLLGHAKRWFLAGLGAFLVGHLAYVVGLAQIVPPERWTEAGVWGVVPVVVGLGALGYLWPRLGSMKAPVIAYVAAIIAMVIAALAAWPRLPSPHGGLLAIGAISFFASDLAVARDRFVARTFTNKLWGLPAYYAGQLLIAWAIR
jgi:uncharacterized membrane protein YhhN